MAEQLAEEPDDLGTRDVAYVEIEVQPQTAATRGTVSAEIAETLSRR
jgi:hypothetical protein